jgi:esterase, PHB depolymerase family
MKGVTDTINHALSSAGLAPRPQAPSPAAHPEDSGDESRFLARSFTNHAGTRDYKLYIPASYSRESAGPIPLLVMLHGCTQSPDDFAAGTRMNALAEEHGFLVVYPAQSANANGSRCWNWFRPQDQRRDLGEPSIIAGITREVMSSYRVDPRRVFVAGMSAGASMALILAEMYPELYAAVGTHSAPPYWAAHDVPSAFAAMQGGARASQASSSTRAIVFHGDEDRTVNALNAAAIVERVTSAPGTSAVLGSDQAGSAPGGRQVPSRGLSGLHQSRRGRTLGRARCRTRMVGWQSKRLFHRPHGSRCFGGDGPLLPFLTASERFSQLGGGGTPLVKRDQKQKPSARLGFLLHCMLSGPTPSAWAFGRVRGAGQNPRCGPATLRIAGLSRI